MFRSALLSVVSHSLSAYITTLESLPLQRLSSRIAAEVSMWMCDLFSFPDGQAHCHDDIREGLVRTVRMVRTEEHPCRYLCRYLYYLLSRCCMTSFPAW